jgi:3-hydroxyacyl-CoA dehydrogenase/enoyl-CoA hydratase/3-hydroxybutyryl-CoA epimerase
MGSTISAHIASCGHEVLLLDIPHGPDKNDLARKAIDKITISKPPLISHPKRLANIKIGNLEDNIIELHKYDLVIEAIVEKIDVKLELFESIAKFLNKNTVIASNTSTLSLKLLKQKNIWPQTIIIHFFNPVRYVSLVELITDNETPADKIDQINNFLTHSLGRNVIKCNDSPGFIANRVGCFFLELALQKAIQQKLQLNQIDSLVNQILGMPKTGIFGLYDLIGLDVMSLIGKSLTTSLPFSDKYHSVYQQDGLVSDLITQGKLGIKSGCGFYKKENNQKLVLDLGSLEYMPLTSSSEKYTNLNELLSSDQPYALYIKELLKETYQYLLTLIPAITEDINKIDQVMELGFNWKYGPIKLAEMFGYKEATKNIQSQNNTLGSLVDSNQDSQLFGYQDKLVFSINTKFNILTPKVFEGLYKAVDIATQKKQNLIIYSPFKHFSAGGDLKFFLANAQNKNWAAIRQFLKLGQDTLQKVKYSEIPVIAAAQNFALGGGCEILLQSNFVLSSIELQAGLIEVGIGLIPAWGGLKEMVLRSDGDLETLSKLIGNILYQNKTSSADFFEEDYLVRLNIVPNPKDILNCALSFEVANWQPPKPNKSIKLPKIDFTRYNLSGFDKHSLLIVDKLKDLLEKAEITEKELLEKEIEIFMELVSTSDVISKISKIFNL